MKKVIFLSLIILFLNKTQNVFANQDAFTVDNIIVEGEIRDNNYREKYIEVAFRKGFQKLIENLIQIKDQKKILSTDLSTIKSLVEKFAIVEEKVLNGEINSISRKYKVVEKKLKTFDLESVEFRDKYGRIFEVEIKTLADHIQAF